MELMEREPDGWKLIHADGMTATIEFYYGVKPNESLLLPVGARFGVVYSANPYVHPQSSLQPWSYVVFEISLYKFRPTGGLDRSYKQVRRRQLTRFEVPHFEHLWTEIVLMGQGRKAG